MGDDLEMQSDHSAYGGVRYALQPAESRHVKQLAKDHGGLTRAEIRTLAREFKVATKPIHHALDELRLPVLHKRAAPLPGSLLKALNETQADPAPKSQTNGKAAKVEKASSNTDHEIEALRRENAKLRHEIDEARRIRAQADADLAKARKSLADTAELRKRTAIEREALEAPWAENEALEETLHQCRMVLEGLSRNYAAIVPRLPKDQLQGLFQAAQDELQRREKGGRSIGMP